MRPSSRMYSCEAASPSRTSTSPSDQATSRASRAIAAWCSSLRPRNKGIRLKSRVDTMYVCSLLLLGRAAHSPASGTPHSLRLPSLLPVVSREPSSENVIACTRPVKPLSVWMASPGSDNRGGGLPLQHAYSHNVDKHGILTALQFLQPAKAGLTVSQGENL